jgi:glycosyltransferase involved in cell wall biosynthesis
MDNRHYLVSAIVSVYNSERFITGCLEDLEAQTIADRLEIIVVNSGSKENEEAIVKKYQERFDNIIYLKTEKRESIYAAWNRAIQAATGTYITNANSDDRHRKDAYKIMVDVLENNPRISLAYANFIMTYNENESFNSCVPVKYVSLPNPEPSESRALLRGCFVGPQPMWRKSIHDEFGLFDESLQIVGDYEFWLRISEKCKFKHINEFLGLYLSSPCSAEHRDPELSFSEWHQVIREFLKKHRTFKSGEPQFLRNIRRKFSCDMFYQGDFLFSNGKIDAAKKVLYKSLGYNWRNVKSYQLLLACYLPSKTTVFLRSFKKKAIRIFNPMIIWRKRCPK